MAIRKVGNEFCVFSKGTGKNLGCYPTRKKAEKRLAQIEFFKNQRAEFTESVKLGLRSTRNGSSETN